MTLAQFILTAFFSAAAKRGDFLLNATIFRFCVRFVAMTLSKKNVPSNSVALPVQTRNLFRCLICSFHLFYRFCCVRIGNVNFVENITVIGCHARGDTLYVLSMIGDNLVPARARSFALTMDNVSYYFVAVASMSASSHV